MRVELLLVEDCPHADAARSAVQGGLHQLGLDVAVQERVGDFPSPTVLVDGVDVMTGTTGVASAYACRLDVPTQAAVVAALRTATTPDQDDPGAYPVQLAVGVTSDRITHVTPPAREVHRTILRGFATTGHTPDTEALIAVADGSDLAVLMDELHDHDVIRLDGTRRVRAAYPFSAVPTAHVVAIDGGPTVYAMCAVDALGMHAMLSRDTAITSADPRTGEPITVTVTRGHATWSPATAVVFVGSDIPADTSENCCPPAENEACTVAAADRCCGVMNFFTDHDSAQAWLAAHPSTTGVILNQTQALRLGIDIFGRLLD